MEFSKTGLSPLLTMIDQSALTKHFSLQGVFRVVVLVFLTTLVISVSSLESCLWHTGILYQHFYPHSSRNYLLFSSTLCHRPDLLCPFKNMHNAFQGLFLQLNTEAFLSWSLAHYEVLLKSQRETVLLLLLLLQRAFNEAVFHIKV